MAGAQKTTTSEGLGRLEFGGPDLPPRRLRNLLQDQVDQSPPGSRIDWCTYYFRDRALAEALMRASDRGVQVRLVMEGNPRRAGANDAVIAMLDAHGLGGGFHLYASQLSKEQRDKRHLHAKIYAFSSPDIAWVGSFNPSGDVPEDADVVAEIGDQDRGHNLLLGIERPKLTAALRRHIDGLIEPPRLLPEWRLRFLWRVKDGSTKIYFYPRWRTMIVEPIILMLGKRDRVRAAISHMKNGPLTKAFKGATKRGVRIDVLAHDTQRRVPEQLITKLREAGVAIRRVEHPEELPMHAKFLLVEKGAQCSAWLGSYNFNGKSRLLNAEILLRTTDAAVIASLSDRFDKIAAMAGGETA